MRKDVVALRLDTVQNSLVEPPRYDYRITSSPGDVPHPLVGYSVEPAGTRDLEPHQRHEPLIHDATPQLLLCVAEAFQVFEWQINPSPCPILPYVPQKVRELHRDA